MTNHTPAREKLPVLTQLCKLIPSHLTASLAKKHGIDKQARTFSAWSHVVSLLFAQLTQWATSSVGELYQARWGIEVFFKQLKQSLQICDFLGHSKEVISWQLWAVLLLYVLMRWQGQTAGWRLRSCCEDTYLLGFSP